MALHQSLVLFPQIKLQRPILRSPPCSKKDFSLLLSLSTPFPLPLAFQRQERTDGRGRIKIRFTLSGKTKKEKKLKLINNRDVLFSPPFLNILPFPLFLHIFLLHLFTIFKCYYKISRSLIFRFVKIQEVIVYLFLLLIWKEYWAWYLDRNVNLFDR